MIDLILIIISLSLSYVWVSVPELRSISLQLTAGLLVVYFLSKRLAGSRWHHILPKAQTIETSLLTAAVAVVVGATGSLHSPFLPLFHIILFISVLTIGLPANITKMLGLTVFLWATSPMPLTTDMWIELFSLPFLMPLMIFARVEFEEAREARHLNELEEAILTGEERRTLLFLTTFLKPKLTYLQQLIRMGHDNVGNALKQIQLIENETNAVIEEIDRASDSLDLNLPSSKEL